MNERSITIEQFPSGVPGLDEVLGGGLPLYSFNLIAGDPGSGKTTLSTQIMFANATEDRPALHFTVLGEPPVKMLRYQQQFGFFDPSIVGSAVRYVNLSAEALAGDLAAVEERITSEVERHEPGIIVVDSFRTVVQSTGEDTGSEVVLQRFIQRLALHLANWEVTSFLVGEYERAESGYNPVFTVADGILWLAQSLDRNSVVRKLHVMKMRGQAPMPGLHTFRISSDGVRVFPRMRRTPERRAPREPLRLSTGVPGLDTLMTGGVPQGHAYLVAGATGTGKSILARQFISAGAERDQPSVLVVFEEHVHEYIARAGHFGVDLNALAERNMVEALYLRPVDLSVDEILYEIQEAVGRLGAMRVVIDSISGFEIALAPTFREEFRESLYRLVGELTGMGVTVMMTVEVPETFGSTQTSGHAMSFLADDIVLLRYAEIDSALRTVLVVLKMRGSQHSRELREYEITPQGILVGEGLPEYAGIVTGTPRRREGGADGGPT
ncbi:MAG TPA: ATPase domain-containing protein [Longimicrobiales bacterium]